jgi:alkylated DNA nucleotide flippase Atl1
MPNSGRRRAVVEGVGVDLESFRVARDLTYRELARMVGARSPRQARGWAIGAEWPQTAVALDRIVTGTDGAVSIFAMHQRRLAWERAHAPKFRDVA